MTYKAKRSKFVKDFLKSVLELEKKFGITSRITGGLGEYDAAMQLGFSEKEYSDYMEKVAPVRADYDFEYKGKKYQVKAHHPASVKITTAIFSIPALLKYKKYKWDYLIYIVYDKEYAIERMKRIGRKKFEKEYGNRMSLSLKATEEWEKLEVNNGKV